MEKNYGSGPEILDTESAELTLISQEFKSNLRASVWNFSDPYNSYDTR